MREIGRRPPTAKIVARLNGRPIRGLTTFLHIFRFKHRFAVIIGHGKLFGLSSVISLTIWLIISITLTCRKQCHT